MLLARGRRRIDDPLKGMLGLVEDFAAAADMPVVLGVVRPAGAVGLMLEDTLDRHIHIALDIFELIGALGGKLNGRAVDLDDVVLARKVRAVDAHGERCGAVPVELGCRRGERVALLGGRQSHDQLATSLHGNLGNGRGVVVGLSLVAHLVHAGGEILELGHALAHGLVLGALSAPLHGGVDARDLAVLLAAHGLGGGLNHRRVLRGVLDGELAGQAIGRQHVVASSLARQLGKGRLIRGADLGLRALDGRAEVIIADNIAERGHRAVLIAVIGELGGAPCHSEQTLVDGERAVDERDAVVGVCTLGLR